MMMSEEDRDRLLALVIHYIFAYTGAVTWGTIIAISVLWALGLIKITVTVP